MKNAIELCHLLIKENVCKDDICIDMTLGNGKDSLFLLNFCKFLYGFDIQEEAINNSTNLLKDYKNKKLILDNHENVLNYVNEKVKCVIYNLGYLPNGNKSITTNYISTIKSLVNVMQILDNNGFILIVCYEGHEEGKKDSEELHSLLKTFSQKHFDIGEYRFINQVNNPPYLITIFKK